MLRFLSVCALLASLIASSGASYGADQREQSKAPQNEGPWKNLVIEALAAAGTHDYPKSEQAFLKAVREAERFGPGDPRIGTTLNSLGLVYRAERKFTEAEAAYRRALGIIEVFYGDSIDVGNVNFNIASVMIDQGRQIEAMPNIRRTLSLYERFLGPGSMKTGAALCMEGDTFRLMKHLPEAEGPLHRCADIRESNGGLSSPELADALHSLALVYVAEGKFSAAEPRLKLAEKIRENTVGLTSPLLAQTMEDHAGVLKALGRDREAEKLLTMSAAIRRNQTKGK
jgi:tetratricopeptide (TPR) repeat protein